MDVPVGFLSNLWNFVSFLPFFFLLFVLGSLKGILILPIALVIIVVGNSCVVLGLWPVHVIWTYYCVGKTKRLGWGLKVAVMISLPLPLVLWPIIAICGSLLGSIGYGFFAPLIATFYAIRENVGDKLYHCFVDGCVSTVEGSLTAVRDFTDFCFHSYFSYMDELSEEMQEDEKPMDITFSKLPKSVLVSVVAIPVDVPVITAIALWKSPYMLFKGWKRLLEDLIGREGPFLEAVCVPFAGLAILLWPLAVLGSVIAAFLSSFLLALYGGVVVLQEDSLKMGLAYVVAVIAMFDEFTNDMLYMREGSCFPRPRYRKSIHPSGPFERTTSIDPKKDREGSRTSKLSKGGSRTLKDAIQQYTPMQVWDWLFKSCEVHGMILLREGLIDVKDIEDCLVRGKCKTLGIKLPAWVIFHCLLESAKSNSSGLIIDDEVELTLTNLPRDKILEWFIGPLFVIKEQVKGLNLSADDEICLRKLIMTCKNERPEDWDDVGFACGDRVKRAQLQAIIRRLQGIVSFMSRIPTFRRRFQNLVGVLCAEAIQSGLVPDHAADGSSRSGQNRKHFRGRGGEQRKLDVEQPV